MKYIILVVFLSVGCAIAPMGDPFSKIVDVPPGKSVIYFYRSDTIVLSVGTYYFIDGQQVAILNRGGYTYHIVDSGEHTVKMAWNCSLGACMNAPSLSEKPEIKLKIDEGLSAYFKLEIDGALMGNKITWGFVNVPEEKALKEISSNRNQNI